MTSNCNCADSIVSLQTELKRQTQRAELGMELLYVGLLVFLGLTIISLCVVLIGVRGRNRTFVVIRCGFILLTGTWLFVSFFTRNWVDAGLAKRDLNWVSSSSFKSHNLWTLGHPRMGSVGARRFNFKNRDGTEVTFGFFTFNITHHSNNERSELQFQYDDAVNQVGMMKLKQEHIPVRIPDLITLIY